jgi:hypothetical protein
MSLAQFLKGDTKIKSWYDENGVDGLKFALWDLIRVPPGGGLREGLQLEVRMSPAQFLKGGTRIKSEYDGNGVSRLSPALRSANPRPHPTGASATPDATVRFRPERFA